MTRQLGYCTNVHAGADLATTRANLEQYAVGVKRNLGLSDPMGVGLWLAAPAARDLRAGDAANRLGDWLAEAGLVPFTLNGFPYGDFHQPVVKHRVYEPTWLEDARVDYTLDLIHVLDQILPAGQRGSISTLPIAWGEPQLSRQQFEHAAANLHRVARALAQLEADRGRQITLCLEPEPGCVLQRSIDIVRLFEDYLFTSEEEAAVRRHLAVCHDVCHAVVMFENQQDVLGRYREAGIQVGKVQVSSAICCDFNKIAPDRRADAIAQLTAFAEDRYLHQTMVRQAPDAEPVFYEDLPLALREIENPSALTSEWRIHFHVPIYLTEFGSLGASQQAIVECLAEIGESHETGHFEVETYAWGVLPESLQHDDLASGIAAEMRWLQEQLQTGKKKN